MAMASRLLDWHAIAAGHTPAAGSWVELEGWAHGLPAAPSPIIGHLPTSFLLLPEAPCCLGCLPHPAASVEILPSANNSLPPGFSPEHTGLRLLGRWQPQEALPESTGWRWQLQEATLLPMVTGGTAQRLGLKPAGLGRRALMGAAPLLCLAACAPGGTPPDHSGNPSGNPSGSATGAKASIPSGAALRDFLRESGPMDMHSHAGRVLGRRVVDPTAPMEPVAAPMREGGMSVISLAVVSDTPTTELGPDHRIHAYRTPATGELYGWSKITFTRLLRLAEEQSLPLVTTQAELAAARGSGGPALIVATEGADFLEGDVDRVDEAYATWHLRHLQLVHYRPNELGDIQTAPPVHGGLTDFGAAVIRRCNSLGLVVDVAHGSFDLTKRAAEVSSKPIVLSHTGLTHHPRPFTRWVTPEHARLVAATGGVVGIWPPASAFPSMAAYARGFAQMVEAIGIDHVGIGTDLRGLTGPSIFRGYRDTPALATALLEQGFNRAEAAKLLGGNYARVVEASFSR